MKRKSPSQCSIARPDPNFDLEELAIPIIAVVLVMTLLGSSLLIIVNAPALFAELLLDGILSASLYRRLQELDQKHWVETAIKKTALPFTTLTALLLAIGWTMQWLDPSASSIGQFISHRQ